MKIPRWLELQQEIDYLLFQLSQIYQYELKLSNIDRMIDEATGYTKIKLKQVEKIHTKIQRLKKEYYSLLSSTTENGGLK